MGELYRLDFASGKSYIGATTRTAQARYVEHAALVSNKANVQLIYKAWRKYGDPVLVVLGRFDGDDLFEAEAEAVLTTLKPRGYNMVPGGGKPPLVTPEVGKKIAAALRGRKVPLEVREKIKAGWIARGGRPSPSPEQRARSSAAQKGREFTSGHRHKLAAAKLGRILPIETKARMSQSQRDRRAAEGCKQTHKEKHENSETV